MELFPTHILILMELFPTHILIFNGIFPTHILKPHFWTFLWNGTLIPTANMLGLID